MAKKLVVIENSRRPVQRLRKDVGKLRAKRGTDIKVTHLSLVSCVLFRDTAAKIRGAIKAGGGPVFSMSVFVPGRGSLGLKGWLCLGALSPPSCVVAVKVCM